MQRNALIREDFSRQHARADDCARDDRHDVDWTRRLSGQRDGGKPAEND
jgi:hypothetical protein